MGISFTEEQQQVIKLRGSNILVAAAAGSGKTAVLVERIVNIKGSAARISKNVGNTLLDQNLNYNFCSGQ